MAGPAPLELGLDELQLRNNRPGNALLRGGLQVATCPVASGWGKLFGHPQEEVASTQLELALKILIFLAFSALKMCSGWKYGVVWLDL